MNPLLEKYEELYGKKEEPNGITNVSLSMEQMEDLETYLRATSGTSGIASVSHITASNANISIRPKPKAIKTFDPKYSKDCFLEIAEKIKDHTAKVTSITLNTDMVGNYHTGLQTFIFEVQAYYTP